MNNKLAAAEQETNAIETFRVVRLPPCGPFA